MSAYETEAHENLKGDADRCIEEIRAQMLTAMENLQAADECQTNMRFSLYDPATALLSSKKLVATAKDMLDHTRNLKTTATLIHENTRKLDHALTQLETLEKEAKNE